MKIIKTGKAFKHEGKMDIVNKGERESLKANRNGANRKE